jgi:hypothetical protein
MKKKMTDAGLVAYCGWQMECESPLEISIEHPKDGMLGRATGYAAEVIIVAMRLDPKVFRENAKAYGIELPKPKRGG